MNYFGTHLSIKDGILKTIDEIKSMNGNMIQLFISNPMSIKESNYDKINSKAKEIKEKLINTDTKLVIHLPYVLNLAKPNPNINSWWIKMICNQLQVSDNIGSLGCVVHVGKYLELTELEGLDNMMKSFKLIIKFIKDKKLNTFIILETAAGQGTELLVTNNNNIDSFANFYNEFTEDDKNYIKICVDTCHIFAAGYDISNADQVKQFFIDFNDKIGLEHMTLIHLNDSKTECGGKVDRHANLGEGKIGLEGLRYFIRYAIFYNIPIILETPGDQIEEIKLINKVKNGVNSWIKKNNIK
jgi:deoxyribonuclease-4